jgi:hypothetical protein
VATEKEMLRMLDFRDTKFTIGTVCPPEKQKLMESMLHEKAAEHGVDLSKATAQTMNLFTLDEALEYLKSLKEIQDKFDARGFPGQEKSHAVG